MKSIGEIVWERLIAEGGFVWTLADGRKFVHFNRGCHCSAELAALLRHHRDELRAFIDEMHARRDRAWGRPPAIGSFGRLDRYAPNGRNHDSCECNGAERSGISAGLPEKRDFGGRRGLCKIVPVVAAVLAANFVACGEIWTVRPAVTGGSVGLVTNFLNGISSGDGEGRNINTNRGNTTWREN